MKKILSLMIMFIGILGTISAVSASEAVRLKYAASVYADAKAVGFRTPEGVGCSDKIIVIADTANGRLLRFPINEGILKTGDVIKAAEISYPVRVQINSKGDIFALDEKQRKIGRISSGGTFNGYLDFQGASGEVVPRSLKIDASDKIYVLDIYGNRVIQFDPDGKFLGQIPLPERFGFFSDLTVDSKGAIYVLDSVKSQVIKSVDGKPFAPLTPEMKEYMNFPVSLVIDGRGIIYLADQNGSAIVILGADGSFQSRQLGFGWKDGLIRYPSQICMNSKGDLFVADRNNNRVEMFTTAK